MTDINDLKERIENLQKTIAVNALESITNELVRMENEGAAPQDMLDNVVWPVLHEAAKRYEEVQLGDTSVDPTNFGLVIKR